MDKLKSEIMSEICNLNNIKITNIGLKVPDSKDLISLDEKQRKKIDIEFNRVKQQRLAKLNKNLF